MTISTPVYRVLVVGVSSYLGSAVAMGLKDNFEVFGTYNENPLRIEGVTSFPLNLKNGGEIVDILRRVQPDIVLYCAGLHSLGADSSNASLAETLNFKAPALFFKVLDRPPYFIYFTKDEYRDPKRDFIAKTKHQGETAVLSQRKNSLVLRLGKLFGEKMGGVGALYTTWIEDLRKSLHSEVAHRAFAPQTHSHLYVGEVVRALKLILNKRPENSQLFELAPSDSLSLNDFAQRFAGRLGADPQIFSENDSGTPENFALSNSAFTSVYPYRFSTTDEALEEYFERLRTGKTTPWI